MPDSSSISEFPRIFVSYSQKDDEAKEEALTNLKALSRTGKAEPWHDKEIGVGQDWYGQIACQLDDCAAAVLLISKNFLASKFCMTDEVPVLLEKRKRQGMLVVPILVENCAWKIVPWLSAIQMRPGPTTPLEVLSPPERNDAYAGIIEEINAFLESDRFQDAPQYEKQAWHQRSAVKADTPFQPLPEGAVDLSRLPRGGWEAIGRDKELRLLDDAFDEGSVSVLALVGYGGVGKSTLISKWCDYLRSDNYRDANKVFAWSFYRQGPEERVASADTFIDAALRFFGEGHPEQGSVWARGERLAKLVSKDKNLLLLDGLEVLQDPDQGIKDPALARLIEGLATNEGNRSLCLITTRARVKEFEGFKFYDPERGSMTLPPSLIEYDLHKLSKHAGRALLRYEGGILGSDKKLEKVSSSFGNHALALFLLAKYLKEFHAGDVAAADGIPRLLGRWTVAQGRHPRRVMIGYVKHLQESAELPTLQILHILGLFDRPATPDCIAALRKQPKINGLTDDVVNDTRFRAFLKSIGIGNDQGGDESNWSDFLTYLRRIGLISPASGRDLGEVDAHPLVRAHFGEDLHQAEPDAWLAGHSRLFEHLLTVPKQDQPDTLIEMQPILQAIFHGCSAGRHREALDVYRQRLARHEDFYLTRSLGAYGAALAAMTAMFERGDGDPDERYRRPARTLSVADKGYVLATTANILRALGRLQEARAPMRTGLKLAVEANDFGMAASRAGNLAQLILGLGNINLALQRADDAVKFAERSGDHWQKMKRYAALADIYRHAGGYDEGERLFAKAIEVEVEHLGGSDLLGSVQGYRYHAFLLGQDKAHDVRNRAMSLIEKSHADDAPILDMALNHLALGRACLALEDFDMALKNLETALEGLRHSGAIHHLPRGLLGRASWARQTGDYDHADLDVREAKRIAVRCRMKLFLCDSLLEEARIRVAREGPSPFALETVEKAERIIDVTGYHRRDGEVEDLLTEIGEGPFD